MKRGPIGARPQTAAAGVIAKLGTNEDVSDDLYNAAQDELDRELAELIEKNKKAMESLNSEVREVSRTVAEEHTPTIVQIKKVARVNSGTRLKAAATASTKKENMVDRLGDHTLSQIDSNPTKKAR